MSTSPRWSLGRLFAWLAISVLLVAVLVGVSLRRSWNGAVARELDAIEASGAPLTPEEFVLEAVASPPWWHGIDTGSDTVYERQLPDPEALAALLRGPDADLAPFERGMLEDLAEHFDELAARGESIEDAWFTATRTWPSPADDAPIGAFVELCHRLEVEATRDLVAGASGACGGARFDARTWIDEWLSGDSPLPESGPGLVGIIRIHKELGRRAWIAAFDGDAETAVECVRLGFCGARAFEGAPGLNHFLVWLLQTESAISSLLHVARFLPEADLQEFELRLASLDPGGSLVRTLEQERAILYRAFSLPGLEGLDDGSLSPSRLLRGLWDANDRRIFLRSFREGIEAARRSTEEARAVGRAIDEQLRSERFALRSQLMVPNLESLANATLSLEVSASLARAVLLCRREGLDAARGWISGRLDPFSGEPYRTAADGEDNLRLWSVGRDGLDDRGTRRPDDPYRDDIAVLLRAAR